MMQSINNFNFVKFEKLFEYDQLGPDMKFKESDMFSPS